MPLFPQSWNWIWLFLIKPASSFWWGWMPWLSQQKLIAFGHNPLAWKQDKSLLHPSLAMHIPDIYLSPFAMHLKIKIVYFYVWPFSWSIKMRRDPGGGEKLTLLYTLPSDTLPILSLQVSLSLSLPPRLDRWGPSLLSLSWMQIYALGSQMKLWLFHRAELSWICWLGPPRA